MVGEICGSQGQRLLSENEIFGECSRNDVPKGVVRLVASRTSIYPAGAIVRDNSIADLESGCAGSRATILPTASAAWVMGKTRIGL